MAEELVEAVEVEEDQEAEVATEDGVGRTGLTPGRQTLNKDGSNGGGSGNSLNSNMVRAADCHRCKYIGNQHLSCLGCVMTTNLDH